MRYQFTTADRSKGGQRVVELHGRDHMSFIGKLGFQATVDKHWNGDRQAYKEYLQDKGLLVQCDLETIAMMDLYRQYRPELLEA